MHMIAETGKIDGNEMANVFNMGIGFILAVESEDVDETMKQLAALNVKAIMWIQLRIFK